jgi:putative phage-type endonuclease
MDFKNLGLSEDLEYHEIEVHTQEWFDFRRNGIGGSEIGSVLRVSDYKSSIELFYEKIGRHQPHRFNNEAMFHGTHLEDYVGEMWRHFDGEDYMNNYEKGTPVREYFKPSGYITSPHYPHLFCSLDGLIPKGQKRMDGGVLDKPGILEIKNMSSFIEKKWADGIPPYYMAQIQMYLMVLELDYAEIAVLKDGRYFSTSYILRDEEWTESIKTNSESFWNNRVVPGITAVKQSEDALFDRDSVANDKYESIIQHLEPEADDTDSYRMWLSKTHEKVSQVKEGDFEEYMNVERYNFFHHVQNVCVREKQYIGNYLRKTMKKEGVDKLDFGDDGYFSIISDDKDWKKNRVNNKLKKKYDKDELLTKLRSIEY